VEARNVETEIAEQAERALAADTESARAAAVAELAALALFHAKAHERAKALTITDEHTGLYNARHLRHVLAAEIARAHRFHHMTSVVFLDLDRFKAVNDRHGHRTGSALLAEMGELLMSSIRSIDLAFRYGGDEFVMVLVETDRVGANVVAERVRKRLANNLFLAGEGLNLRVTASFGVASFPEDAATPDTLLEAADAAMYRAKDGGRNCVRNHST
jgi:diguanylate cyclase (GGDEF)-like protein